MLKNLSQLELIIEDKICRFMCDFDTPLTHVKEALFQFQKYIGQIEDAAKAKHVEEKSSNIEEIKQEQLEQVS